MMHFPANVRIFVALDPIDMRKSHHGLASIIRDQLQMDPLSGHFVFFTNKRRNLAKIFFFDRTGMAFLFKRLEQGTFQLPRVQQGQTRAEIQPADLAMILEGIDLDSVKRRKRYSRQTDLEPTR